MSVRDHGVQQDQAVARSEITGIGSRLPYHAPEIREYGGLQDLTQAGGSADTHPSDGPIGSYGTDGTPPIS